MPYIDIRYAPGEVDPSQLPSVLERVGQAVATSFDISIASVQVELVPQNTYVLNRKTFDVRVTASYGRDDARARQLPALADALAELLGEFCNPDACASVSVYCTLAQHTGYSVRNDHSNHGSSSHSKADVVAGTTAVRDD
jgi:hypothetical protein